MNMTAIRATMEKVVDMPALFLLLTLLVFAILGLLVGVVVYFVACGKNKGTEMNGIMRVTVERCRLAANGSGEVESTVRFGTFGISMKDPQSVRGQRLDESPNWKRKPFCREYPVGLLLNRFLWAYQGAGLGEDSSAKELEALADSESFCRNLGKCRYRNRRKGLMVSDAQWQPVGNTRNKVRIRAKTNSQTEYLYMTLEYQE